MKRIASRSVRPLRRSSRRAALHENLSEALPAALKDFVQSKIPRSSAFTKVEQVRLMVLTVTG